MEIDAVFGGDGELGGVGAGFDCSGGVDFEGEEFVVVFPVVEAQATFADIVEEECAAVIDEVRAIVRVVRLVGDVGELFPVGEGPDDGGSAGEGAGDEGFVG